LSYSDDISAIRNYYNNCYYNTEDLVDDETINYYNRQIYERLYDNYLSYTHLPGYLKDTVSGKYIILLMMNSTEFFPYVGFEIEHRLEQITDQEEKYRFIHDSIITVYELFPERKRLNYSYDDFKKLRCVGYCNDEEIEQEFYFENDSIAKSRCIQSLSKNKRIVLNFNYSFDLEDDRFKDEHFLDNIEFVIQNFSNNQWVSSDTLLFDKYSLSDFDCFRFIDYKPNDFILFFFKTLNFRGPARYAVGKFLLKIDINNDKFLRYEVF
jgi:hypothetical protein